MKLTLVGTKISLKLQEKGRFRQPNAWTISHRNDPAKLLWISCLQYMDSKLGATCWLLPVTLSVHLLLAKSRCDGLPQHVLVLGKGNQKPN